MATECSKLASHTPEVEKLNITTTARLTMITAALAGVILVGRAVVGAGLEWGLLAMIAFVVATSGLSVGVGRYAGPVRLNTPLSHVAMFAGALAMGPPAAVVGAFSGISAIIFSPPQKRSLLDIFYIIFKPAAVCAVTSGAFTVTGGETLQPHSVNSVAPAIISGFVYAAGHALAAAGLGWRAESGDKPSGVSVAASWSLCLLGGYLAATIYAAVPAYIMIAPAAVGLLALTATRVPQVISVDDEISEEVVEQVVEVAHEQEEPVQEAITPSVFVDELTGLASHRYLMMFLDREVSRSLRTGSQLAVAAFDIDGFSRLVNADEMLVEMGRRLKSGLREYDLVARHASGRLVVVLPDTNAGSAIEVCRRLHSVCSLEIDGKPVSVSAGIALLPDNCTSSEDLINASHYAINKGRFTGEGGVHVCERLDKAS